MPYKIIPLKQGSQEWLSYRKNKITATDTAAIMGLDPWKTPLMLWQEKLDLRPKFIETEAMKEGRVLEEEARDFFNKKTSNDFSPVVLESTIYPFMMVSLDGMNSNKEIQEIKCGKSSYELAKDQKVAPYYYAQVQKQMYVADAEYEWFLSFRSKDDNVYFTIQRDDDFIKKMIEDEKIFYRYMMDFTPPPLTDKDYTIRDDVQWQSNAKLYKEIRLEIKKLEQKEKALKNELIVLSGGNPSKGNGVTVSKSFRLGNIDYSSISQLKDIDLDQYRKPKTVVWTIREV